MRFIYILFLSVLLISPSSLLAGKVDINRADAKMLAQNLKGIGDKKAKAIIKYRKQHGSFENINQLLKVKGIGKKILADNRDNILLGRKGVVIENSR